MRRLPVLFLAVVAVVGTAFPASAGTPGKWSKVAGNVDSSLPLPGVVRTSDKVLHVAWDVDASSTTQQYRHRSITKAGRMGSTTGVLASPWSSLNHEPKLVRDGSGIRMLFSGYNGGGTGYFYQATSPTGSSWSSPAQVSQWQNAYASYGIGADTFANGTPIVGGALNSDIYWHVGTVAAQADGHVAVSGASVIRFNLGVDRSSDQAWAVWYDVSGGGVWGRQLTPSVGAVQQAPASLPGGSSLVPGQQMAMVARQGGGLYTAYCRTYPSCKKAVVWKVGTSKTIPVKVTSATDLITLGDGGAGRLWVVTHDNNTGKFYAARSNKAATRFGARRTIKPPAKSLDAFGLVVEGSAGRGDVLANVVDTSSRYNIWHTQVLPGLSLSAKPRKWDGDFVQRVLFKVRDAGAAVAGAKVTVAARSCKTSTQGTCTIKFPKMGPTKLKAVAKKSGYASASLRLTVRQ